MATEYSSLPLQQKRALAIHDISGFGRCSLTVALPVLSAVGIECSVLPTAVLSTHTGGFEGYTFRDLTKDLWPIAKHWASLGLAFDAIYTGYLGSFEQIELVRRVIELLCGEQTLVVVDPVMADAGKLYPGFPEDFPCGMRKLCSDADVIVPNLTEAALLLGRPYQAELEGEECVPMLSDLCSKTGARSVVLTGIRQGDLLGAASYDTRTEKTAYYGKPLIKGMYHGTGDVFSSALAAALMDALPLAEAVKVAVTFTHQAIARSHAAGTDRRFGVNFEAGLAQLPVLIDEQR